MIRINLAKTPGSSKKAGRAAKTGGKSGAPGGKFFVGLLLVAAMTGGVYYYLAYIRPAQTQEPLPTALPPPVPKTDADAAKPSSLVRTNMAEGVVREIDESKAGGKSGAEGSKADGRDLMRLNAPYSEMPIAEKINYEVLFARNVFDLVTRCTPPGIKFRSLDVENFQTICASGEGLSREMVQEMFSAFKSERGDIMPKPQSHIKDDGRGSFMFVITYKPRFGLNVSDPFQALDHIGFKESIPQHLKTFSRLARDNKYMISAQPAQISSEKAGNYRRVVYKASGMTSYRDFHGFTRALHDEKVPCAFRKVIVKPVRDEEVRVDVEILFSVKE